MSNLNKYHIVYEELHKLIDMNPKDIPRREMICAIVKRTLSNSRYMETCKIELDTKITTPIEPKDILYMAGFLFTLNVHIEDTDISTHDMKYVLYSVIVVYLATEVGNLDYIRSFFDIMYFAFETDPRSLCVRAIQKQKAFCC